MTLSSLTLYGPNATWWARGLGIVGGALFALCLGLLACDFPLEKLFAEKSPATVGNGATCRTHFDELLRSTANASDKSSILGVWPTEVRLAGRLCLVVTGIASKGSESQLVATLNEKKYGADRAKQRYDSAVSAATNARQELANAEAKANVAEREKAPDVEQLRASALKLAADSDEKEKLRTAAFDALTVANKAYEDAAAEANRGAPVVDVTLFLNERRTPLIAKAMATSGPQLLTYEFGQIADANTDDAKFWRDLVAFSWNITTAEGRDGVRDLLEATLAHTDPQGLRAAEPPTGADGVDEAWIEFETAVGRGRGHLRLQDGKGWTLLTTLYELTGHEEPVRDRRPKGAEHGIHRDRETWRDRREREARERLRQARGHLAQAFAGAQPPASRQVHRHVAIAKVEPLRLAQAAAGATGAATPLGKHAQEIYKAFDAAGHGGVDFSGIIQHVRSLAGK